MLRDGHDATIIACGIMTGAALKAAETLAAEGVQVRVLNMGTIRPTDTEAVVKAAQDTGAIVTAEEHLPQGGLGSIVATVLAEHHPVPMKLVALQGYAESGKADELLAKYRLTPADVAAAVRDVVARKRW
jgi:transketolase